ncbi:MAG: hypothetical protein WC934_06895 [Acidithiobacillus sp.]|jgi:hypothetical protein|uniref:hypothetical protein n=1 Tax=Acidithiobacillus sp. TaxID=1872118 RepID=UPI00355CA4CC
MPSLRGEDKIFFYTVMGIYTEIIVCLFLIPVIGILVSTIIIGVSIPITMFSISYYKLVLFKKLREEIGSIPFWTGWFITKNGDWHYVDFGVVEKEEIQINDAQLDEYENQLHFKEIMEKIKEENDELYDLINESDFEDQYVNSKLDNEYKWIGLSTSRQIYAFEMIRALYDVNDNDLSLSIIKINEVLKNMKENKTNDVIQLNELLKEQMKNKSFTPFEQVLLELVKINKSNKYSLIEVSEFLENLLIKLNISDKMAYNSEAYKKKILKLHDVERIGKNPSVISSNIKKNSFALISSIISIIINIILLVYMKNVVFVSVIENQILKSTHILIISILFIISFIPVIFGIIYSIKRFKNIQNEAVEPVNINIINQITKNMAFNNFCEIKSRLRQFSSDARIYKVFPFQKYRKMWDSDYIIVILPASYEDSLDFDVGNVSHKGHPVEVQTTPIVMVDIGSLYGNIPMYLMVACTYHFKRFTKIFYNYHLLQNWKNKAYLYLISQIQSKYQITDADKQTLTIRVSEWQNWAIEQAQEFQLDRERREQELLKSRNGNSLQASEHIKALQGQMQEMKQQYEEQIELIASEKKKKNIIIGVFVILCILLFFILIIPYYNNIRNTALNNQANNSTSTISMLSYLKTYLSIR